MANRKKPATNLYYGPEKKEKLHTPSGKSEDWAMSFHSPDGAHFEAEKILSALELIIFYISLQKIDPLDPNGYTVHINLSDITGFCQPKKLSKDELLNICDHLMQPWSIEQADQANLVVCIPFSEIVTKMGNNGHWQLDLTCGDAAKEYLFNATTITYFRSHIADTLNRMGYRI